MVNGPIARAIGMNSKGNVFGQGNRANAAIGRTLQLVVRNVGGGRPGEIDRSVFGSPAKYSFCFAEDEDDPRWEVLCRVARVFAETIAVTMFPGDGITQTIDHISRTPEDLCRNYAPCLRAIYNTGHVIGVQAFLAVGQDTPTFSMRRAGRRRASNRNSKGCCRFRSANWCPAAAASRG